LAPIETVPALDIGCGTGYLLRAILSEHPDCRVAGLDLSGEMIRISRKKADNSKSANASFIKADWETEKWHAISTRLDNRLLTHIICANTFHYFQDPQKCLRKIASVLPDSRQLLTPGEGKRKFQPHCFMGLFA
jgi:ubiquinone/menaquinone biosynthesis C-methylase UbiE